MSQFYDTLKVAKFLTRFLKKKEIDIESIQIALCFFETNDLLNRIIQSYKPDCVITSGTSKFGQYLLDAYEAEPEILLDDASNALRKMIENDEQAGSIQSKFPFPDQIDPERLNVVKKMATAGADSEHLFASTDSGMLDFAKELAGAIVQAQKLISVASAAGNIVNANGPQGFSSKLLSLHKALDEQVLDQPFAINQLYEELQARDWELVPTDGPAIFLLVGPPSCGKTFLTRVLSVALSDRACLTINMASFSSSNEGFGLTGLRKGYDGAAAGLLTSFVHENPRAIVVLDNIDQAHPNVQNLLLPLFTEGILIDDYGFGNSTSSLSKASRSVSFKDAVVLFTTNMGSRVYERSDYKALYANEPQKVVALLREEISNPANRNLNTKNSRDGDSGNSSQLGGYLGRAQVLPFQTLGLSALTKISQRSLVAFKKRLESRKVEINIPDLEALSLALTLSQGPEIDAKELDNAATRRLLAVYMQNGAGALGSATKVEIVIQDETGLLLNLGNQPKDKVLSNLLRRSEMLKFDIESTRNGELLQLRLTKIALIRVPVSSDYGDEGGMTLEIPRSRFDDVFGHTLVKQRLAEVVRLLKQAPDGTNNPIGLPKGMLLFGQPGTGKTMLAKALAAEADLPFISVSGPQLLDINLIKTVFKRARKFAPSLVFIDEVDALGVRGSGGNDPCINQLLTEIDGFVEARDGNVFVIAATNYPKKVDPALTRSGRLDLFLEVPMLDRQARSHFIDRIKQLPHADNWDAQLLVELSAGMTGADLEKLCREATLDLIRRPRSVMTQAELLELLNSIKHGARVENPRLREQMQSTAYHEAGHAIVSMALNPDVRVEQVTIVPRRDSLGFTAYTEESLANRHFNRHEVMDMICVALAGRVAESKQFPALDSQGGDDAGASSDLARATGLAWTAITEWGLDDDFGWVSLHSLDEQVPSIWMDKAGARVNAWLEIARKLTEEAVQANWALIEKVATYLLEHEMIDGETLRQLMVD